MLGRGSAVSPSMRKGIPLLFLMNAIFGMMGIVWTQDVADILNVIISYIIYFRVLKEIK